ncbi:db7a75ad-e93a-49f4-ac2e-51dc724c7ef1 [Thermothielavioides terrestris]|uniref:DUF4048 domain-containing protein n=2 Tax=Thermothielavioides terrestris TaxID=2587410 RepID=G2QUS3_THETT|nr:uncharacterized protein THITE_2107727 [Thermothielavioides terrestris NRRL 8126]AEO62918.1 hypothetical protein THITE_2107727 [Thermothielavioides terrestris NRRL 8126]SPQ21590.1 db7a75ad-e93a-49f4-ac2e-51dc724c7ef1 [Thermothielavioides terrestris]
MSPVDPNDFITAIAAQERRVLELREELSRAESDLARLKKQWATHEAYKKRAGRRNIEALSGLGPAAELQDETAIRRSVELDRRKALLGQQNQQATPERSRRRVFTGSHTRTLSLLSPTKTNGGFDDESESSKLDADSRFTPAAPALPAKRASWASRPTQATAMKQLAEDLKTGIWTFMEDLRQATVGDEPITGQGTYLRGMDGSMRPTVTGSLNSAVSAGDQDTIRASGNPRPRATSAFEDTPKTSKQEQNSQTGKDEGGQFGDVPPPKPPRPLQRSKTDAGTTKPTKRFSWTPLAMDSVDDNDWSNWDSPSSTSPRWSGTTVNGDIIPSIPESDSSPSKKKPSANPRSPSPSAPPPPSSSAALSLSPHKLEDLLPPVLNRLTPSNLKRVAGDFMKEWERSLSAPDSGSSLAAATATARSAPVAVGKEKGV